MKLSRNSKLVKWAYLMRYDYDIPGRTNVCALFWRSFLGTPLSCVFVAILFTFFSPFLLWDWLRKTGRLDWLHREIVLPRLRMPSLPGGDLAKLAAQRARDWKSGVCTIVEIE